MSKDFDKSLLESPYQDERSRSRAPLAAIVVLVVALVAGVFGALWASSGSHEGNRSDDAVVGGDVPESTAGSVPQAATVEGTGASTTLPIKEAPDAEGSLVEFSADPALLYYPTLLPQGWEICRQVEDSSAGDRFCDPDDEDSGWVQVEVEQEASILNARTPTGDSLGGEWLDGIVEDVVAYSAGGIFGLVITTDETGPKPDDLLAIAQSIPLVSNHGALKKTEESALDLDSMSEEDFAKLAAPFDPDARVSFTGEGDHRVVRIQMQSGLLSMFSVDGSYAYESASSVPMARLVDAERPLVVGESPSRNQYVALWDQRGYGWRLEGTGIAEDAAERALRLMMLIAELG